MPAKKTALKLDRERELKFTMPAITLLDEMYKINLYDQNSYLDFPPSKMVSLIWAAQLHTKNPLRRDRISQYLPTNMVEYMEICVLVAQAIRDAIKDPTPQESADSK